MAVVMMDGDEKNPVFHDFLGMSSGTEGDMESSDLGSEKQEANNYEGFHFHGKKNEISEETSNLISGRKRSSSSSYISLIRDRMLSVGSDSLENSRLMKAFGKEVARRFGKSQDDEMPSSMQPPPRPTSSLSFHPPVNARPHLLNAGSVALVPQAAADEGSRTGMKGSGIFKIINSSSSGAGEKVTTGALPYGSRPKALQIVEPRASNIQSRQMTIFYGGQAHVFDDVHPSKADVIMALAGSNGGSWSTGYSKLGLCPPVSEAKAPNREKELRDNNLPLSILGVSDPGLIGQAARNPPTNDLRTLTPGVGAARDSALIAHVAESDPNGKRDA